MQFHPTVVEDSPTAEHTCSFAPSPIPRGPFYRGFSKCALVTRPLYRPCTFCLVEQCVCFYLCHLGMFLMICQTPCNLQDRIEVPVEVLSGSPSIPKSLLILPHLQEYPLLADGLGVRRAGIVRMVVGG